MSLLVNKIGTEEELSKYDIVIKDLGDTTFITNFGFKDGVEELTLSNEQHVLAFEIMKNKDILNEDGTAGNESDLGQTVCVLFGQPLLNIKSTYTISNMAINLINELRKLEDSNINSAFFSIATKTGIVNVYISSLLVGYEPDLIKLSGILEYVRVILDNGLEANPNVDWMEYYPKESLSDENVNTVSIFLNSGTTLKTPKKDDVDEMLPSVDLDEDLNLKYDNGIEPDDVNVKVLDYNCETDNEIDTLPEGSRSL